MLSSTLPPEVVVEPVFEVTELNSSLTPWPNCSVLVCPKPVADLTWSSSCLVSLILDETELAYAVSAGGCGPSAGSISKSRGDLIVNCRQRIYEATYSVVLLLGTLSELIGAPLGIVG